MAIGIGTVFIGFWVSFFGFCSLKGPGVGFVDLIVPGRLSGHVIPNPGSTSGSSSSTTIPAPTGTPGGPPGGATEPPLSSISLPGALSTSAMKQLLQQIKSGTVGAAPSQGATGGTDNSNPNGPGYDLGNLYG